MTDTAREADIVLPAKTMFEQSDVINAYWHDYIQIKQKVIEPPGEVKTETEVYRLLAERLGFPEAAIAERLPGPSDEDIEAYLEKRLAPFRDLSLEKLKEGPIRSPDHEEVAFSDRRFIASPPISRPHARRPARPARFVSENSSPQKSQRPFPVSTETTSSPRSTIA